MSAFLDQLPQWIAAVGGTGGITFGLKYLADRRRSSNNQNKTTAEATRVITDTAVSLIEPLERAIADLRTDLETSREESIALRDDVQALHEYITVLIDVIRAANLPVPARPTPAQGPDGPPGRRRRPPPPTS